jgi:hypothetical protein
MEETMPAEELEPSKPRDASTSGGSTWSWIAQNGRMIGSAAIRYIWMVGLGAVTLSLVILSLAAYQFQDSLTARSANGATRFTDYKTHLDNVIQRRIMARGESERLLLEFQTAFESADYNLPDDAADNLLRTLRSLQAKRGLYLELPAFHAKPAISGGANAAVPEQKDANFNSQSRNHDILIKAVTDAYDKYLGSYRYDEAVIRSYIDQHPVNVLGKTLDDSQKGFIEAVYHDLLYFDKLRLFTAYQLDPTAMALMPPWMLSLYVTLAMGAMGSLLYVMRSFLQDKLDESAGTSRTYRPLSWFIMRPLMGVVTALAFFVVIQAGLLVTDGAVDVGGGGLNPYFGAAVALVCGLMSWQAIQRIELWGKRFFGEEMIQRWGYGLKGAFSIKPEKTKQDLAKELQVTEAQLDDWIEERQRIPQDIQDKIAAWFGIDRRHLFSDQSTVAVNSRPFIKAG